MGYAKRPGGLWDTIGILGCVAFLIEVGLFVAAGGTSGDITLYLDLHRAFFNALTTTVFSLSSLVLIAVTLTIILMVRRVARR